jgi:hypothetical protein
MSLQPPEYWLDMHNTELRLTMAEAERLRRRKEAGVRPARRNMQWRQRLASLATRAAEGVRRSPRHSPPPGQPLGRGPLRGRLSFAAGKEDD